MKNDNFERVTGEVNLYKKKNVFLLGLSSVGSVIKSLIIVLIVAGGILSVAVISYLVKLANEPLGFDLDAKSLNQTSFIYVQDKDTGEFYQYHEIYDSENRVWIDYEDIPKSMIEAVIAIEDKRFESHNGVDWIRTGGAAISLITGGDNYGGSTLTQQLIKNMTGDNDTSIARKLREIFRALNLEKKYSKDEIIEAYLNVVNFGGECQGIEAASQLYFGHSATDCSIAECAAIVGITQNPSKWNPLIYPENNQIRREIIIEQMYEQGKITQDEYDDAMQESATMTFVGYSKQSVEDIDYDAEDETSTDVQNWYIDATFRQVAKDISAKYNITVEAAEEKICTEGLKIYCAMDLDAQNTMQEAALGIDKSDNPLLETAMTMVGYDGRVIATVGSSFIKEGALVWDRANMSVLQPGSAIKPIVVYPYALDNNIIHYSSMLKDQPLESWGEEAGPSNWYRYYKNRMTLFDAIDWSSNATVVQVMSMIGPENAYAQAVDLMGFKNLTAIDAETLGGLSIGGLNGGVTVTEMANALTYIGNGGKVYDTYTYYYITDQNDNIILDNRDKVGKQAYSAETATIMNRLLYNNVRYGTQTAAPNANVYGWEIAGKTGTTDDYHDSWFVGASPYCTLAIWCGFDDPTSIRGSGTSVASKTFAKIMSQYLEDKEYKEFELSDEVTTARYCAYTGKLADKELCTNTKIGYYTWDNMPSTCTKNDHEFIKAETKVTEPTVDTTANTTENTTAPTTEPTVPSESDIPTLPTDPTEPSSSEIESSESGTAESTG